MTNISEEEYENIANTPIETGEGVVRFVQNPMRIGHLQYAYNKRDPLEKADTPEEAASQVTREEIARYEELSIDGRVLALKNEAGYFKRDK